MFNHLYRMTAKAITSTIQDICNRLNTDQASTIHGMMQIKHGLPIVVINKTLQHISLHVEGLHQVDLTKKQGSWDHGEICISNSEKAYFNITQIKESLEKPTPLTMQDVVRIMAMINTKTDEEARGNIHSRWFDVHYWLYSAETTFAADVHDMMTKFSIISDIDLSQANSFTQAPQATKDMLKFYDFAVCNVRQGSICAPLETNFSMD